MTEKDVVLLYFCSVSMFLAYYNCPCKKACCGKSLVYGEYSSQAYLSQFHLCNLCDLYK